MKLTNLDLIKAVPFFGILGGLHLKAKLSYRVAQVLRQAGGLHESYEAVRLNALKEFAKKDEAGAIVETRDGQGNPMAVLADKDGYEAKMKELNEIQINIAGEPIKLDDLGDVNLPGSMLAALHWLIVE